MCLLYTFVKNQEGSEVLPYLQGNKFYHQSDRCWWKKTRPQSREDVKIITVIAIDRVPATFFFCINFPYLKSHKGTQMGPDGCSQVVLQGGKP